MKETIKKCLSKRILALAMAFAVTISMMPATVAKADLFNPDPPTKQKSVPYSTPCGVPAEVNTTRDYTVIDQAHAGYFYMSGLDDGWYVVKGKVSIDNTILRVKGDVNLILADGCDLSLFGVQIERKFDILTYKELERYPGSLTIWGQAAGNGKLTINGNNNTYNNPGMELTNLTINGGEVNIIGGNYFENPNVSSTIIPGSPGIFAYESVTINGGKVTAKGGDGKDSKTRGGDAISSKGTVTITGGSVNATGGIGSENGYSLFGDDKEEIYGGNGRGISGKKEINITGGEVTATGTSSALVTDASAGGKINIKSSATVTAGDAAPGSAIAYDAYTSQKYAKVSYPASNHNWNYTADGATITAACSRKDLCKQPDVSITLSATSVDYTGNPVAATLSDTTAWTTAGIAVPAIKYIGTGTTVYAESETAPTEAGTYKASITVEDATASVEYEIKVVEPEKTENNETSFRKYTKKSTVNVPKTVTKNGVTYTVTSLKSNAFDGKYVKKVVLPATIKKIESKAFYKDNKLRSIKITSKKLTVAKNAFKGIKKKNLAKIKVTVSKKMSKKNFNTLKKTLVKQGLKSKNIVRK